METCMGKIARSAGVMYFANIRKVFQYFKETAIKFGLLTSVNVLLGCLSKALNPGLQR